jgi:hypothetical protein
MHNRLAGTYGVVGQILDADDKPKEAAKLWRRAIELAPENPAFRAAYQRIQSEN